MLGQPGRERIWQDELLGPQDATWEELIAPARDFGDVYQGLAEGMGLRDARPVRQPGQPRPDAGDLRDEMGL